MGLTLRTGRYHRWRVEDGAPLIGSSLAPRRDWHGMLDPAIWQAITVPGIAPIRLDTTHPDFPGVYRRQLDRNAPEIDRRLAAIAASHPAAVVLCWCDLTRPGVVCHRTMLAGWLSERTGRPVTELHPPPPTLFDPPPSDPVAGVKVRAVRDGPPPDQSRMIAAALAEARRRTRQGRRN